MGLQAIQGIGPATMKKLNSAGVRTLDDMREMDIDVVAKKTGVSEMRLREWKTEAKLIKVLDDVKGIGPATKKKLQAAGIHSLDDLARAAAHEVAHAASVAEERVKAWQKQARKFVKDTEAYVEREAPKVRAAAEKAATQARKTGAEVKKRTQDAAVQARKTGAEVKKRTQGAAEQARRTSEAVAKEARERVEAFRDDTPDPSTAEDVAAGTNGQKPTFLTRLKRLFVPRQP